ncbi:hypothetical protein BN14_06780 [Rhizoctonia solani AG-1 IB]|uniref:Uncharacterized protein n=1 Tax=Thanatephorus cucumeris (strain AG1-IB / isolate 7/3/14) TaxID=1108050 RepID=M5CA67_THACB|nr:hypothetical protein BN14_06780 [Rhizoctonia solani AG-1 IB]
MRGRGRGNQNQARGRRNFGSNRGAARTSTRSNRGIKNNDRGGLEWLPSVSRSSGLEPNGDALRSFETQQEYWEFITEKIMNLELPGRYVPKSPSERQEKESNAMILLRKLREGFVATDRRDDFAVQGNVNLSLNIRCI